MKTTLPLLLALSLACPAAAQDLPPDMLADKLVLEADAALASGDPQQASRALREVEALDVEPPAMFAYVKGRALTEHGDGEEAWRRGPTVARAVRGRGRAGLGALHPGPGSDRGGGTQDQGNRKARSAQGSTAEILQEVGAQMVRVEGGTFTMGCTPEQEDCARRREAPRTPVLVESFEIGRFEMTQELWQAVTGENPSAFADCPGCPVETVSWDDVQAFLRRLNAGGAQYRLPSEAEWEYAARGGQLSEGYRYAGSGNRAEVAWYHENSGNGTQPVGRKRANELGLFDMSGNVREWIRDCWHGSYDGAPGDGRAREEGDCGRRVIRGGSWSGKPGHVRSTSRFWYTTSFRNNNLGFRVARTIEE